MRRILNRIEKWFKNRIEEKYRLAGFEFVYINKFGIRTYVHPEKLFNIIETTNPLKIRGQQSFSRLVATLFSNFQDFNDK